MVNFLKLYPKTYFKNIVIRRKDEDPKIFCRRSIRTGPSSRRFKYNHRKFKYSGSCETKLVRILKYMSTKRLNRFPILVFLIQLICWKNEKSNNYRQTELEDRNKTEKRIEISSWKYTRLVSFLRKKNAWKNTSEKIDSIFLLSSQNVFRVLRSPK